MTAESENRTYSVSEALAYAKEKIKYCDCVEAEYPNADMRDLRAHAATFLRLLENQPRDPYLLHDLLEDLRRGKKREGTGWFSLLSYVGEYVERLERIET